jgi:hypothetical protein
MSLAHINRNAVSPWSKEMKDRVRGLAREGFSAGAIGRQVGLTKNQIIGWVDRNCPAGTLHGRQPKRGRHKYPSVRINTRPLPKWAAEPCDYDGPTFKSRMDELERKLNEVMEQPLPPRIPVPPKQKVSGDRPVMGRPNPW